MDTDAGVDDALALTVLLAPQVVTTTRLCRAGVRDDVGGGTAVWGFDGDPAGHRFATRLDTVSAIKMIARALA